MDVGEGRAQRSKQARSNIVSDANHATRLAAMMRLYRKEHRKSLRYCARDIGIHYSTLARAERSMPTVSTDNFVKIIAWLLQPPRAIRNNDRET